MVHDAFPSFPPAPNKKKKEKSTEHKEHESYMIKNRNGFETCGLDIRGRAHRRASRICRAIINTSRMKIGRG